MAVGPNIIYRSGGRSLCTEALNSGAGVSPNVDNATSILKFITYKQPRVLQHCTWGPHAPVFSSSSFLLHGKYHISGSISPRLSISVREWKVRFPRAHLFDFTSDLFHRLHHNRFGTLTTVLRHAWTSAPRMPTSAKKLTLEPPSKKKLLCGPKVNVVHEPVWQRILKPNQQHLLGIMAFLPIA